jgi:GT2 family glycosyltransferase
MPIKIGIDAGQAVTVSTQAGGATPDLPLVSVIVPTLGRPDMLRDALASIVAQTYPHWEAIVVNDGGEAVETLVLPVDPRGRIRYVEHGRRHGPASARNTALRLARGEIICYLDDDDRYLPGHLETMVAAMRDAATGFVFTDVDLVIENIGDGQRRELERSQPFKRPVFSRDALLVSNHIPINAWAHRFECVQRAGYFDEQLPSHEDWELLLRFARHYEFQYLPHTTVEVRSRRNRSDSRTGQNLESTVETYREIYRRTDDMVTPALRAERDQKLVHLNRAIGNRAAVPATAVVPSSDEPASYERWIDKHALREIDAEVYAERMMMHWPVRPPVHLIIDAIDRPTVLLAETLDALGQQLYPDWRLTIIASSPAPDGLLDSSGRLAWMTVDSATGFPSAVNALLRDSSADWVGLLRAGDTVEPHLLLACVDYINRYPGWRLIYTDEDTLDESGTRREPRFKPDFNLDLLRSQPYVGGFCLTHRETLLAGGGYAEQPGAENYDAAFKVLDLCGAGAIGHIASLLFHVRQPYWLGPGEHRPIAAWKDAVSAHLARVGTPATVCDGLAPGTFRVVYRHADRPLVTVIIPSKDRLNLLRACTESLFRKTAYPNFELVVVDNGSEAEDTFDYYQELQAAYPDRVRVLSCPGEFNYSAMNNLAAREARGKYLVLLNNDTVIIQPEWLDTLMTYGQRPEVGVVGARLIYPDSKIQHAGIVLGMLRIADHPYIGNAMDDPGYLGRAQCDQNYSAVTGACLLIRKSVFNEVGGLDAERLRVSYNDVDLCLKARERGYEIVWTPHAVVVHHGSVSQRGLSVSEERKKRFEAEQEAMLERWLPVLANDPAHNRHLSLATTSVRFETEVDAGWDPLVRGRPRILCAPMDVFAVGNLRTIAPLKAIETAGLAHVAFLPCHNGRPEARVPTVVELERLRPDVFFLQSGVHELQIERLRQYKRFNHVFKVYDFEDLKTQASDKNSLKKNLPFDFKRRLREVLSACDRMTVTTEPLREAYRHLIDDIRVVPLRLERARWGQLQSRRRQGQRPRVGWAGAQQHHGDLELLMPVIQATHREVDWVFFGMCLDELEPYVREVHSFVSFEQYPARLASLNLDLAVAPLEYHAFNEAKTNLRLLEYGVLGWPVVCTDILPYQNAPVMRVPNDTRAWIDAIRERVHDLDTAEREGDRLRQWVMDHWILEDHLDEWLAAFTPDARAEQHKAAVASA